MDWPAVTRAELIAAFSAAIALLSASYTWRNYRLSTRKERRELEASKPLIQQSSSGPDKRHQPWFEVSIQVRNRADHRLYVTAIRLLAPKSGEIGFIRSVRGQQRLEFTVPKQEMIQAPDRCYRPPPEFMMIEPAGSYDSRTYTFHLMPSKAREIYSVQLELEERLAEIRRSTKIVKIRVPPLNISAASAIQSARDI